MTRLEALVDVRRIVSNTQRHRLSSEAPTAHTLVYVDCELAVARAMLGDLDSAASLHDISAGFGDCANDRLHVYLVRAFIERIDVIAGRHEASRLPVLDKVARYKANRLREASRLLEPNYVDAIGEWIRSPRLRLQEVEQQDAVRAGLSSNSYAGVYNALDLLRTFDRERGAGLIDIALTAVGNALPEHRAEFYAMVLAYADATQRSDLYSELLDLLRDSIAGAETSLLGKSSSSASYALRIAVPVARRASLHDKLVELIAAAQNIEAADDPGARAHVASAMAVLGDLDAARLQLDACRACIDSDRLPLPVYLSVIRAYADASAALPSPEALSRILGLEPLFACVSDSYGTNTHFCISVLHFTDSLAFAIATPRATVATSDG